MVRAGRRPVPGATEPAPWRCRRAAASPDPCVPCRGTGHAAGPRDRRPRPPMFRPISSETRSPVCRATSSRFRSRRPIDVDRSGIASSAAASSRSRKSTVRLVWRFAGMASTRWQCSSSAGSRMATKRKKPRIAALRTLRVRMLFFRSSSTKARNPATRSASMSATDRSVGLPRELPAGVGEQEPEGVPVACHGVRDWLRAGR